jgi:hypothetical protein
MDGAGPPGPAPSQLQEAIADRTTRLNRRPLLPKPDRPLLSPARTGKGAVRGWFVVVRDCPLRTVQDRCEWHVRGAASADDLARRSRRLRLDRRVRPSSATTVSLQAAKAARQLGGETRTSRRPSSPSEVGRLRSKSLEVTTKGELCPRLWNRSSLRSPWLAFSSCCTSWADCGRACGTTSGTPTSIPGDGWQSVR